MPIKCPKFQNISIYNWQHDQGDDMYLHITKYVPWPPDKSTYCPLKIKINFKKQKKCENKYFSYIII